MRTWKSPVFFDPSTESGFEAVSLVGTPAAFMPATMTWAIAS
jgi:hypothetical protein